MTTKNLKKLALNKPLYEFPDSYYPEKYNIEYHEFEPPKTFDLLRTMDCKKIDLANIGQITFGVKAGYQELEKYDFLWCLEGPAFVVHQRVLDKLNELCPNDIQALPMVIKNLDPKKEYFENKNFWLINILNEVEIIDYEKTAEYCNMNVDSYKALDSINLERCYLKNADHMNGRLIARIKEKKSYIIFHPSLAGHFVKSKGIQFRIDDEIVMPYRDELWNYLHIHYSFLLKEKGEYEKFISFYGWKECSRIIETFKDEIFMNYCPNCGNLKKTPKARQCLKCMEFHDPVLVK